RRTLGGVDRRQVPEQSPPADVRLPTVPWGSAAPRWREGELALAATAPRRGPALFRTDATDARDGRPDPQSAAAGSGTRTDSGRSAGCRAESGAVAFAQAVPAA